MKEWILRSVAALVVAWTALPLLRHGAWWIRAFEFPRVQFAVLTAAVLAAYLALAGGRELLDLGLLLALGACLIHQLLHVAPYTPLACKVVPDAAPPNPERSLGLLIANVLTPNRDAESLLRLVRERKPDLLLALETDAWWQEQLDVLEADYPFAARQPQDNLYGLCLYSKLELRDPEVLFLVEDGVPSVHATLRLRSGHQVELHALHPAPPSPSENPTSAERDAELLVVARSLKDRKASVVVLGDMNDVAWSNTLRLFRRLSGLRDVRIGRGLFNTFHAKLPGLRWPLDHVFVSPDFGLVSIARLPGIGSDHFPLHVVLAHQPGAAQGAPDRATDAADREQAQAKVVHAQVDENALRRPAGLSARSAR